MTTKIICNKCGLMATTAIHNDESNRTRFFCNECGCEYENQLCDAGIDYRKKDLMAA